MSIGTFPQENIFFLFLLWRGGVFHDFHFLLLLFSKRRRRKKHFILFILVREKNFFLQKKKYIQENDKKTCFLLFICLNRRIQQKKKKNDIFLVNIMLVLKFLLISFIYFGKGEEEENVFLYLFSGKEGVLRFHI